MIQVPIPTELEPFVQDVIQNGKYHDPEEVVGVALHLLARREKLLYDVKAGLDQLDRGEYTEYDEDSCRQFQADIEAEERSRYPQADNL